MKINTSSDKKNQKIFKQLFIDSSTAEIFNCILCGNKVSINNSYSIQGSKLVCTTCVKNKFNDNKSFKEWQDLINQ